MVVLLQFLHLLSQSLKSIACQQFMSRTFWTQFVFPRTGCGYSRSHLTHTYTPSPFLHKKVLKINIASLCKPMVAAAAW